MEEQERNSASFEDKTWVDGEPMDNVGNEGNPDAPKTEKKKMGVGAAAAVGVTGAAVGVGSVAAAEAILHDDPEPVSEPQPEQEGEPETQPQPEPQPGPRPQPRPEPEPTQEPAPQQEPSTASSVEPGDTSESEQDEDLEQTEEDDFEPVGDEKLESGENEDYDDVPEIVIDEDQVIARIDLNDDSIDDVIAVDLNDNSQIDLLVSTGMNGEYDALFVDVEFDDEGNLKLDEDNLPVSAGIYEVNARVAESDYDDDTPPVEVLDDQSDSGTIDSILSDAVNQVEETVDNAIDDVSDILSDAAYDLEDAARDAAHEVVDDAIDSLLGYKEFPAGGNVSPVEGPGITMAEPPLDMTPDMADDM